MALPNSFMIELNRVHDDKGKAVGWMAEVPGLANQQGTGTKPKEAVGNLLVQYKTMIRQSAREARKAKRREERHRSGHNGHAEQASLT